MRSQENHRGVAHRKVQQRRSGAPATDIGAQRGVVGGAHFDANEGMHQPLVIEDRGVMIFCAWAHANHGSRYNYVGNES